MNTDIFTKKPFKKSLILSVFFIYMTSCLHSNQILVSSSYYQLGFNIPAHNIPLYLVKLFSLRYFFEFLGSIFEPVFYKFTKFGRIHTAMTFLGIIFITRLVICSIIFLSEEPSIMFYYISNLEAFVNSVFQICLQIVFVELMSLLMIAKDCSAIFASIVQMILNTCFYNRPLLVVLIQHIFSFMLPFIGFILWYFFICKYNRAPFIRDEKKVKYLKELLEYFKLEIMQMDRDELVVVRDGLINMGYNKKNLLNYLKKEMIKFLEEDKVRLNYAKELIEDIRTEYDSVIMILNYEDTITEDSKINPEIGTYITMSEQIIEKKLAMLNQLIDETEFDRKKLEDDYDLEKNLIQQKFEPEKGFWRHLGDVMSPTLMIIPAVFFKKMLYPNLYPYGLLESRKWMVPIVMMPFGYVFGSIWISLIENNIETFEERRTELNKSWLMLVPLTVGLLGATVSVHSTTGLYRRVLNSTVRVGAVGIVLMTSYSIMRSASCVGIADYIAQKTKNRESSSRVLNLQNIVYHNLKYLFYKFSITYSLGRKMLGYRPPDFNVTEADREQHTFIFWIKYLAVRTILEIINDFSVRIRIYS